METYKITAEGRLMEELYHVEDRSDPNAEGFLRALGCMTRIHDGWKDMTTDVAFAKALADRRWR